MGPDRVHTWWTIVSATLTVDLEALAAADAEDLPGSTRPAWSVRNRLLVALGHASPQSPEVLRIDGHWQAVGEVRVGAPALGTGRQARR